MFVGALAGFPVEASGLVVKAAVGALAETKMSRVVATEASLRSSYVVSVIVFVPRSA